MASISDIPFFFWYSHISSFFILEAFFLKSSGRQLLMLGINLVKKLWKKWAHCSLTQCAVLWCSPQTGSASGTRQEPWPCPQELGGFRSRSPALPARRTSSVVSGSWVSKMWNEVIFQFLDNLLLCHAVLAVIELPLHEKELAFFDTVLLQRLVVFQPKDWKFG